MLAQMADAETILRGLRRPLVIGMGGGGDVVGALATAEFARLYDGTDPALGGLSWERRPIDPAPGPRSAGEIAGAEAIAPGTLLAGPDTHVADSGVRFAESRMAGFLAQPVVLLTLEGGAGAIAEGLLAAAGRLGVDGFVFIDVGGDVLAHGDEPGLRSPLCDAIMLAAAGRLAARGVPVLAGIFGIGCDAELTPAEVFGRLASVASAGGLAGIRGLTEAVALKLEQAIELVPTEASAQAVRAFRGATGTAAIRGGTRSVQLTPAAASTFYLDVPATIGACGRLAQAVDECEDLEQANRALNELGVRTELDLERDAVRA
jgi:hypothetical protein